MGWRDVVLSGLAAIGLGLFARDIAAACRGLFDERGTTDLLAPQPEPTWRRWWRAAAERRRNQDRQ